VKHDERNKKHTQAKDNKFTNSKFQKPLKRKYDKNDEYDRYDKYLSQYKYDEYGREYDEY
jgi:hypothetical protein